MIAKPNNFKIRHFYNKIAKTKVFEWCKITKHKLLEREQQNKHIRTNQHNSQFKKQYQIIRP